MTLISYTIPRNPLNFSKPSSSDFKLVGVHVASIVNVVSGQRRVDYGLLGDRAGVVGSLVLVDRGEALVRIHISVMVL